MARPPSVPGFEQYFPSAPKVKDTRSRADRAHFPGQSAHADSLRERALASESDATGPSNSTHVASYHESTSLHTDGNGTPPGEIPSTVDSTSSHNSTGSSIFSSSLRLGANSTPSRLSTTSLTPRTSKESPSHFMTAASSTPDMASSTATDYGAARTSDTMTGAQTNGSTFHSQAASERIPARDPLPSIKGSKCTYDPLLDRHRKKAAYKSSKPIYETFGLVRTIIYIPP
jgi:histone-lysine N-methyltransferase SETD1